MKRFVSAFLTVSLALTLVACDAGQGSASSLPVSAVPTAVPTPTAAPTPNPAPAGLTPVENAPVLQYDQILPVGDYTTQPQTAVTGYFTVEKDGLWGLIASDGTELLPCRSADPVQNIGWEEGAWQWTPEPYDWDAVQRYSAELQALGHGGVTTNEVDVNRISYWYDLDAPGRDIHAFDFSALRAYTTGGSMRELTESDWETFGEPLPIGHCREGGGNGDPVWPEDTGEGIIYWCKNAGASFPDYPVEMAGFFRQETIAPYKKEGKWGYYNRTTNAVTPCVYDAVFAFEMGAEGPVQAADAVNGYAVVCRDGRWGLLNEQGVEVLPCAYDGTAWDGETVWVKQEDGWQAFTL